MDWYRSAMQTTIDQAGRVVVPKPLRDALGLPSGTKLEVTESEGRLILTPTGPRTRVVRRHGRSVLEVDEDVEPLTAEQVRDLLERTRR